MAIVDALLLVVRAVVFVYDCATFPVYHFMQTPWEVKSKQKLGEVKNVHSNSKVVSYCRDKGTSSAIYEEIIVRAKVDTVTKAFNYAVSKFGARECLGTREIIGIEDELQKNGKMFRKLALGEYTWMTYDQAHFTAGCFGSGLRQLGLIAGDRISMYAETRAEWILSCLGAFSQNIHVSTVYTNLGDEAVVHALKETEAKVVVTSQELLPRFVAYLEQVPSITHVICMEDAVDMTSPVSVVAKTLRPGVSIIPWRDVVQAGSKADRDDAVAPTPDDTAIIMYTSGSTGTPKGVVLTHRNLIATMTCLMFMLEPKDDVYIAYLPLAHVLELLSENTMMLFGVKVGYSSPHTMTDMSTKVLKGYKGDATVLKPTMMCAVPLIMDRIYKNIMDSVDKRGPGFRKIFDYCYNYKLYWLKRGRETPICDRIIFSKIRAILGGHMKFMLVGGAPLSADTHDFIRTCMGVTVVQGYSLTESCCTGTVMENIDLSTSTVGKPMTGMEVKLLDWDEGNYRVTDRPNPRGEICLSGAPVAKGYFKQDAKTAESFFEENGKRWFRTGDIGEFGESGTLRIIDRKKDLVKLQLGEYVSLGKVEAHLKTHPLIENICVYGDPFKRSTVAIVVPSRPHLEDLAHRLGKTESFEQLCSDDDVISAVQKLLTTAGLSSGLEKFEIPAAITLCLEQWTPESGLITAAFKLKRKVVQDYYQPCINRMYEMVA